MNGINDRLTLGEPVVIKRAITVSTGGNRWIVLQLEK